MAGYCPPYLNKWIDKLEKEYMEAERKELKAKKDYEFAQEYTKLCAGKLEKAKKDEALKG